jgi:hypothetical protein
MNEIVRVGTSARWSDVDIHAGAARWVDVAEDATQDAQGQIVQVLRQIDATLGQSAATGPSQIPIALDLTTTAS